MKLSAPTQIVFLISVVIALLAIIAFFVPNIPVISGNELWTMLVAYIVLLFGNVATGA